MADPPRYQDADADAGDGSAGAPGHRSKPGAPRWVKAFGIIALVLGVVLVVAVLSGHGPGRHMGGRGHTSGKQNPDGVGGPAVANGADRMVEVSALDPLAFQPSRISVSAGETVTFVVTNMGQAAHEFTLGDTEMQQEHAQAMSHMPAGMAHDMPNSIVVQPGETKTLTWRFGDTAIEYACHVQGHYQAGMRGQITIT